MATLPDFHALFEASPNPYMVLDRELRYVAANAAYLRVTASRLEDLLGRYAFDIFPNDPEDPENVPARRLRESFQRVFATRSQDVVALIPYRTPMHTPEGIVVKERFWSATHTPLLDDRGEVAFILQHTVDVSELEALRAAVRSSTEPSTAKVSAEQLEAGVLSRARTIQELNRSLDGELRHLRRLFAQAPGFICFLLGREHVFELANDAYLQLIGHREVVGQPVRAALPELRGQGFYELLDQVFATGQPFVGRGMRAQLQRRSGGPLEERFVDFMYQPILEPDGQTLGIFVQGHDVTEQKRLESERAQLLDRERAAREEAEAANRLKDDFLATVSHELRTPLTAVLGWVQMLRSGRLRETSRERALETVERNARAQAQLIEDLLDVSRILAGKLKLEMEAISLAAPVEAAIESVLPAAEAKGVVLERVLDATLQVNGDPTRVQQMAWNLLSNAVKFTPPGGRVEARVERRGGSAELVVADSGQGISAAFLPCVFERFRQAEAAPSRTHAGLGLGLSIVKHLVEAHGGSAAASSEGEGRGATFRLSFPLATVRGELVQALLAATPPAPLDFDCPPQIAGMRVVVVDDERDVCELLRALLEHCGMTVDTAASAEEGLALFRRLRPDVLVSDLAMPGEDGFSLIRRVRALSPDEGGKTPAVALTAYARPEDRTRALLSGYRAHLPKPVEPRELAAVLASLANP
jgi:PAS domain S-box-containing protein